MKSYLILGIFLIVSISAVNAQEGNACSNPKILSVHDSLCQFYGAPGSEISPNFDSIPAGFFNNRKIKPKELVWYKFLAVSKNVAFQVRDAKFTTIVFFSGSCGNLTQISAYSTYLPTNLFLGSPLETETVFGAVESLVVGQEYYIQISSTVTPFDNDGPVCLFKLPDQSTKIISKPTGGSWLDKSSWFQGRIPTAIDTVIIADGSTIKIDVKGLYAMKRLELGQGGPASAHLLIQSEWNNFALYGDLVIHSGDSLIGKKNAINNDRYYLYGNILNNGVCSYLTNPPPNIYRPVYYFRSVSNQTVDGFGSFIGSGVPSLVIDNPAGVKWNMDGYTQCQIYLKRGLFDNMASNLHFFSDTSNFNMGHFSSLGIENGTIAKRIPNISTRQPGFKSNMLWFGEIKDDDLVPYQDIQLDSYFPERTRFNRLDLEKRSGKKVVANRSLYIGSLNMPNNCVLIGPPTDTISFRTCLFSTVSKTNHIEFGHYRNSLPTSSQWSVPAWVSGKGRRFTLWTYYANGIGLEWLHARVLNQPPSGSFSGPVSFLIGPHVLEIKANVPLAPTAKLRMEVLDSDSLPGLKSQWRLVQAPTPNGPWTILDVTSAYVDPADPLLDASFTTTNPISLANGNYFAFASTGQAKDAVLNRVLPVPTYPFGCGGTQSTAVKMLVSNLGMSSLTNILVGAVAGGNLFVKSYINGVNWTSQLAVGGLDTFQFDIPGTLSGNVPVKYFVSTDADGNRANDTIKSILYTNPLPLPVSIDFDTCNYLTLFVLGLNTYGHPIVNGWENGPKSQSSNNGTFGNAFGVMRTDPPLTSNKIHLKADLYLQNNRAFFRTSNFGPIGASCRFSYKFNIVDMPGTNEIRTTDTLTIEASNDCGETYKPIRIINKSNFLAYIDPTGQMSDFPIAPVSRWWDSIPFPAGSIVHFRIRMKTNQSSVNFSEIRFDDFIVADTILTASSPLLLAQSDIHLYPNPAGEELFVVLPGGEVASQIRMVDMLGRVFPAPTVAENRIALKGIPPGIYTLEVTGRKCVYKKRFVKE